MISLNQTSGTGNSQVNGIGISVGANSASVNETVFAEASAEPSSLGDSETTPAGKRRVSIVETAFVEAGSVVQVNQTTWPGNISTNRFALNLPASAKF